MSSTRTSLWQTWSRRECLVFGLHALVVVLTAIRSEQPFQLDEHFQIIEFASFKLGMTPEHLLPWEYKEGIRGWFLPTLAMGPLALTRALGGSIGTALALWRVISGIFAVYALYKLLAVSRSWYADRKDATRHQIIVLSTAFLPYLAARPTSENYSGSFFLLGFSLVVGATERERTRSTKMLEAGLWFGLAFVARMQCAPMLLGIFAWWFVYRPADRKSAAWLVLGGVLANLAVLPIDSWGYGHLSLPVWGYIRANIIDGVAAKFSVEPWYAYAYLPVGNAFIVSALVAYICTVAVWVRIRNHPLTWVMLPSLVFHSLLGHKEERFLFPLAPLAASCVPLLLQSWPRLSPLLQSRIARSLWIVALFPTLIAMLYPFHWHQQASRARAENDLVPASAKLFHAGTYPSYFPIYRSEWREYAWDPNMCCLHAGDFWMTNGTAKPPADAKLVRQELPRLVPASMQDAVSAWSIRMHPKAGDLIRELRWWSLYRIDQDQANCPRPAAEVTPDDACCKRIHYVPISTARPTH
jgi:GPI mannosyltransferase 3